MARTPFGVGDDRKLPAATLASFVIQAGVINPDGAQAGKVGKLYVQQALGFFGIYVNTDGISAWSLLFGSGVGDPNGVVKGVKGAVWNQIPGDGTATLWINTTGAMVWV